MQKLHTSFVEYIQSSCMFSLEKLTVLTAGRGNIPHTPEQQPADGKDNAESKNLFPDVLGVTSGNIYNRLR